MGAEAEHIHADDVDDESWPGRPGTSITWRTLVGRPDSATVGLSAGVATLVPAGGRLERHRHAPPEVYHVLDGVGVVTVGDERFDVRAGSTVYIPSLAWHAIDNTGPSAMRLFYCFAADRFADVRYEYAADLDDELR